MRVAINAIALRPGGGLTVLLGLMRGLQQSSGPLDIVVFCRHSATRDAIIETGSADQIESVLQDAHQLKAQLWQHFRLRRHLQRCRADVLLTFNHYLPNMPCPQVVYHINLRRFVPLNDAETSLEWVKEKIRNHAAHSALRRATANVFESNYLRDAAIRSSSTSRPDDAVSYIGLPDELVDEAPFQADKFDGRPQMLAITSPYTHKDNPVLIETLAELVRRDPNVDWRLEVAGGERADAWRLEQSLAEQLDVANRVRWHGFCSQSKLDQLSRQSLCLLAPSRLESFALIALEAMARRCPSVVARAAAMPESVGHAALLATPGDVGEFADAVQELYHRPELRQRLVNAGLEWIQDFRWSRCGKEFYELFERIAA